MNEKIKNQQNHIPATPFSYFWFVSKPHKWWMISAACLATLAAGLDQSTSYLFKLIVDAVESGNTTSVFWFGVAFPVVIFVNQMLFRLSGYFGMRWSVQAEETGTNFLFDHVTKHSHSYFSNRFAGGIQSKVRNVIGGVNDLIPELLWSYLYSLTALLVTLGFILSVDYAAAGIFILLVIILLLINTKLAPHKQRFSKLQAEASTELVGSMVDVISNVGVMKQYTAHKKENRYINKAAKKLMFARRRSWTMTEYMLIINTCVLFVFSVCLFLLLINRWQNGLVTTGEFVLIASLISQLSGTLLFIGRAFNSTARTIGEMKEGLEELMIPHDIIDVPNATELRLTSGGRVVFSKLTFNFEDNPVKVFDDFNLIIPAGQRVGLVGSSGAGKSTFVALLLRQHDVTAGQILIDNQNISKVSQDSLRQAIAVVPQDPALFHRSIRENIAYGKSDATQEEIEAVARKAQAHDFIVALPEGYDTLVGERGVKLSGGQKQRVAIARAMLKDAPILVLDEATSALDSESEVEIQKALHILMNGKTVIAVAHRLSTLREMDRIIVLESGRIIEDGTHETLKDAGGTYAKLWSHQAGGFINEEAT
jgi:ATP-binding cassette, subfamily B, bacterial